MRSVEPTGRVGRTGPTLPLSIDNAGRVALFGVRLTDDQLLAILRAAAARDRDTHVVVTVPPSLAPAHRTAVGELVGKTDLAKLDFVEAN